MYVLIGAFSVLLTYPFFLALFSPVKAFLHAPQILWPIAIGTGLGIIFDQFILRKFPAIETFEHEFTHAFVSVLFFRNVYNFVVSSRGGYVRHSGGFGGEFGDDMIGLAPYFLPTFTLISAFIRPFLGRPAFPWFDTWIGFTFGYHIWSTIDEVRKNWHYRSFVSVSGRSAQSDIGRRGKFYSALVIVCFGLATHGIVLALITKGYSGVPLWARQSVAILKSEILFLFGLVAQLVKKLETIFN